MKVCEGVVTCLVTEESLRFSPPARVWMHNNVSLAVGGDLEKTIGAVACTEGAVLASISRGRCSAELSISNQSVEMSRCLVRCVLF